MTTSSGRGASSGRFRLLRELGSGGMGIVWLAEDAVRGERVALKRASVTTPDALRRFKREFRAVASLRHPGLVRLLELGQDEQGLYLLMEPCEGVDLRVWCGAAAVGGHRGGGFEGEDARSLVARPEERLRRLAMVLPLLADALAFLHARGIVHGDLKPSNVLVDSEGCPKLLDFGLLAEVGRTNPSEVVGTVGYIAPELTHGEPPSPRSDVYALGVMCFELIAGEPPFAGSSVASTLAKVLSSPPPRLEQCWPEAPLELSALLARAMARDPATRASLEALVRGVRASAGMGGRSGVHLASRSAGRGVRPVVGRGREQDWLRARWRRAREGRCVVAVVEGPSGIGKTALCQAFAHAVEGEGCLVVRGRARPEDRTPFGGLDEALDELADQVDRLLQDVKPSLRGRLDALRVEAARLFPAVAPPGERSPAMRVREQPVGAPVAALAEFVHRVAELVSPCSLLIFLDDAQWLGPDARTLLRALLARRPPRVMLLLARRDVDDSEVVADDWLPPGLSAVLRLAPLRDDAVRSILQDAALRVSEGSMPAVAWERLVHRCEGMPILAELFGRAVARLDVFAPGAPLPSELDLIGALLTALSPRARWAFALLVARDDWLPIEGLAASCGCSRREAEGLADELSALALAVRRVSRDEAPSIRVYHDRVVEAARRCLPADRLRSAHRRLADWLGACQGEPAERVRHLLACGDVQEARRLAPEAARRAEARRAWALAARMHEVRLRDTDLPREERQRTLRRCAEAWDQAGLHHRAIPLWRAFTEAAEGYEAVEGVLGEVAALLGAARLQDAWRSLRRVSSHLPDGGGLLPDSARRLVAAAAFFGGPWIGDRISFASAAGDEGGLREARLYLRLGTSMSYFDAFTGMGWIRRAQRQFDALGAVEESAWCDYLFAHTALFVSARKGRNALATRYREAGERRLRAVRSPSDAILGMRWFVRGASALHRGDWREAREHLLRALDHVHRVGMVGTVGHTMVLVRLLQAALFADDPSESGRWLAHMQEAARGRGTAPLRHHLAIAEMLLGAWRGQWGGLWRLGERVLAEVVEGQPPSFTRVQVAATVLPLLGLLRAPSGHLRRLEQALRRDGRFFPMRTMYAGQFAALRAHLVVRAVGERPSRADVRLLRRLASTARRAPPFHAVGALRALARIEERAGVISRDDVLARFEAAEREALGYGQRLQWALARHARGLRTPGAAGSSLRKEAMEEVARLGVAQDVLDWEEAIRGPLEGVRRDSEERANDSE